MVARAVSLLAALLALAACAPLARAQAHTPWSFRLGGATSHLEGALGAVYPEGELNGVAGVAWRSMTHPYRLRTGLNFATHAGSGTVPVRGLVFDPAPHYVQVGEIDESWSAAWLEVPVHAEVVAANRGEWHPYAGAGAAMAYRLSEAGVTVLEVPVSGARRFVPHGSLTLGLEHPVRGGVIRVEVGYGHGLQSLYAKDDGPGGTWNAWTLLIDVGR